MVLNLQQIAVLPPIQEVWVSQDRLRRLCVAERRDPGRRRLGLGRTGRHPGG